ncbi:MAG: transglutaminase-like domain-containing protein [Polyangiaceae bacterium]
MSAELPLRTRLLTAVPLAIVLVLYAYVSGTLFVSLASLALLVATASISVRLPADRPTQRVFGIVVSVLSVAIVRASLDPEVAQRLHAFWVGVIVACVIVTSFRALCSLPDGGIRGTMAIAMIALLSAGETRIGTPYIVAVVAFLAAALFALRAHDPSRPPLGSLTTRTRLVALGIVVSAALLAAAVAVPARPLANLAHRKVEAVFERAYENRTSSFSDGMRLGKLSKMLRSNTVAVRLYGKENPELLRVVVFDTYDDGMFTQSERRAPDALVETRRGPLVGDHVTYAIRGSRETDRFFLPLGTTDLATADGQIRHEPFGVLRGTSAAATKRYWFRIAARSQLPTEAPHDADLGLPEFMRRPLRHLANEWSEGVSSDEAILEALDTHLRHDFHYALDRDHSRGADPVHHFLFRDRTGHCEYFAAAMTLLARSKGIPARYVSGYRVTERNPIDGHYVVREKNAHSWVEAYVAGKGWRTFDPTPLSEPGAPLTTDEGLGDASTDFLASLWERAEAWLVDRTLTELSIAAGIGTFVFALVRWWGNRNKKKEAEGAQEGPLSVPLPSFTRLLAALDRQGFKWKPYVPIERFARELPDETARDLLLRYSAHRYGAAEDPALPEAMLAYADLIAKASPPPPERLTARQ